MNFSINLVGTRCCASAPLAAGSLAAVRHVSIRADGRAAARPYRRGERGSATILVLALLAIMAVFLTSNQRVLHNLKREVRLVEEKQLKKFQPPTAKPAEAKARP
jgi:hypothetical protein